jgi:hypothetical protein
MKIIEETELRFLLITKQQVDLESGP